MLTRDIALEDAILDLLDNCVDGIVRTALTPENPQKPYEGFVAKIVIEPDKFFIEDNCGGIPFDIARDYAFALGRKEDVAEATKPETIGMYGIGMKRAIFKIGREAFVQSKNDHGFVVYFDQDWMRDETWRDLEMQEIPTEQQVEGQTTVAVFDIREEAKAAFSEQTWIDDFKKIVSRHYALIIEKGFEVRIGTEVEIDTSEALVKAENFQLLMAGASGANGNVIAPFVYRGEVSGVRVEIYVGLYRQLLTEEELELEEETRGRTDDAGWTVACNDRIVVWKDRSRLTGWGEASVPNYHGQFIAITGIVLLTSKDLKKLPLTTTKRGIDASTEVYSVVKDMMRDATKKLTTFTNKWKKFPKDRDDLYKGSKYVGLDVLRSEEFSQNLKKKRGQDNILAFEPTYPEPIQEKTSARVSFIAEKSDIEKLSVHFFGERGAKPAEVGERSFNKCLALAEETN